MVKRVKRTLSETISVGNTALFPRREDGRARRIKKTSKPPMKGNYYAAKCILSRTLRCVLDHDILFKWYVTEMQISWPPFHWKKKRPRHSGNEKKRKKKKEREKSKTMENVANATGRVRHGSPFNPLLSFPSFFFFTPHPTRVFDNRSPLVLRVRPSAQFALLSGSFAMDDLLDSSI